MNTNNINIGLSSTLFAIIQANPGEYNIQEIANRVCRKMQSLSDLKQKDKTKHAILSVVYAVIDELMKETAKEQKLSCRKGCAFCCKMNVDVSPLEIDLIIDYCKENNLPINQEYLKLQSSIPKHELGFTPILSACTFLSKENTCTIYPVRPVACRKYVVITPSEQCDVMKYPDAQIGAWVDLNAEILASAVNSLQNTDVDSLPKMLLKKLGQNP